MSRGFIYLMQAEGATRIKIGYSGDPVARMAVLQIGSPCELTLLGKWPADPEHERHVHEALRGYRCHGEWFEVSPDVAISIIQSALNTTFEPLSIGRPLRISKGRHLSLEEMKEAPVGLLRLEIAKICVDAGLADNGEVLAEAEMLAMDPDPQPEKIVELWNRLRGEKNELDN